MNVSSEPSKNKGTSISISNGLLIEPVDDGALVFDLNSGATTLINHDALTLLITLKSHSRIEELELFAAINWANSGRVSVNDILALLEKSQLVYRC